MSYFINKWLHVPNSCHDLHCIKTCYAPNKNSYVVIDGAAVFLCMASF